MNSQPKSSILVIGAGSWGTALAIQFGRTGRHTLLWGRAADHPELLAEHRENRHYLPGAMFPESLEVEPDLVAGLARARDVLVSVPSHAFREILEAIQPHLRSDARLAWATKGFELDTGKLPHQVAGEIFGSSRPLAVLSGPTFAKEVGAGLPTALTVAATDPEFARELAKDISSENFRAYTTDDLVGVEVGGAVKNVLAIGAGICDGLGYGANTRIAMINRGLVEMTRLGIALGANKDTFMGLAGMGDLVLTCTDNLSRNRRMGLALASGKGIEEAQKEIGQVVEGVLAAKAVWSVSRKLNVDMPICEQIYLILYENKAPQAAVEALMGRELRQE
ncbi:MAG: NAD(P)-dependent glycerol-3-phosphate dehydrogenase [Chromatiales bacterium]|nr:NAD(P)-dependent glycerol-3-phosphate dehydrogenase [Chromatiales bacterium]